MDKINSCDWVFLPAGSSGSADWLHQKRDLGHAFKTDILPLSYRDWRLKNKSRSLLFLPEQFLLWSYSEENITKISEFESVELTKRLDAFYYEPDNYGIGINNALKIINLREIGKAKAAEDFILNCQKKYLKGRWCNWFTIINI